LETWIFFESCNLTTPCSIVSCDIAAVGTRTNNTLIPNTEERPLSDILKHPILILIAIVNIHDINKCLGVELAIYIKKVGIIILVRSVPKSFDIEETYCVRQII